MLAAMQRKFDGQLLRRLFLFSVGVAVTLSGMGVNLARLSAIANPDPLQEAIATLRNSPQRWLEINLSTQRLIAWEGGLPVYAIIVSTGKAATPTYPGIFTIEEKRPLDRMRGADYDVPDVPYAMYYDRGYAIHGAYWHHNFGTPVSHGCTNVAVNHAQWLFNWAEVGTPIVIHY